MGKTLKYVSEFRGILDLLASRWSRAMPEADPVGR